MSDNKDTQELLFDMPADWEAEWQGMPEYIQNKKESYRTMIIRFDNEKDVQDFAKIIGQKITAKTKSIWHPFKSHWGNGNQEVYVDES